MKKNPDTTQDHKEKPSWVDGVMSKAREGTKRMLSKEYKMISDIVSALNNKNLTLAKEIKDLNPDFDWLSSPEYVNAVKEAFYKLLDSQLRAKEAKPFYDEWCDGINFSDDPKYTQVVKNAFYTNLRSFLGLDAAINIKLDFGKDIDFTDEIIQVFLETMKEGNDDVYPKVFDIFQSTVNFRAHPKYHEAVRQGFIVALKRNTILDAFDIQIMYGVGVNFTYHIDYIESVQGAFLHTLSVGDPALALRIRNDLGQGKIALTSLPDYKKSVKEGFTLMIKENDHTSALKIFANFGSGVNFDDEFKELFIKGLQKGSVGILADLEQSYRYFPSNIEVDMASNAKQGILECLKERRIDDAFYLHEQYAKGVNLDDVIDDYFINHEKELQAYLLAGSGECSFWRQLFDIRGIQNVSEDILEVVHKLIFPFSDRLTRKIIMDDLSKKFNGNFDLNNISGDQLSYVHKVTQKYQKQVSDRINALISPDVMKVYRKRNLRSIDSIDTSSF